MAPPRCTHPEVNFAGALGDVERPNMGGMQSSLGSLAAASGLTNAGSIADAAALKALESIPLELGKHSNLMNTILKRLPKPIPDFALAEVAKTCESCHGSF